MTQGKRKDQIDFSNPQQDSHKGECYPNCGHVYDMANDTLVTDTNTIIWNPKVWGDDTLDINGECGDGNSIISYEKFIDVPAGAADTIIVDGILYKINEDKDKWVPLYEDENVRWIGENGDTIWE